MERFATNAMYREWRPKHGVMFTIMLMIMIAIVVAFLVWTSAKAYAQGASLQAEPGFDVKGMLHTMIPVIWASVGPLVIASITKIVNGLSGKYVPQSIQVILSTLLGAIGAAMADGGATVAATAMAGGASQVYAATKPETLNANAPKK